MRLLAVCIVFYNNFLNLRRQHCLLSKVIYLSDIGYIEYGAVSSVTSCLFRDVATINWNVRNLWLRRRVKSWKFVIRGKWLPMAAVVQFPCEVLRVRRSTAGPRRRKRDVQVPCVRRCRLAPSSSRGNHHVVARRRRRFRRGRSNNDT